MLFVLIYFDSGHEGILVSAGSICNVDDCTESCFEDECHRNLCNSGINECVQKGYGRNKRTTLSCQAWRLCAQMCSDGECLLTCDGSEKCTQECYGNQCTSTCNDGNDVCEQQCFSGNCSMTCNSPSCNQECHVDNCIAKCPHGVDECTQVCYVENCDFSCHAKTCNPVYMKGNY